VNECKPLVEVTTVRRLARDLVTMAEQHWRGATAAIAWRAWRQAPVLNALANRAGQDVTLAQRPPCFLNLRADFPLNPLNLSLSL
jgi:hypothetical protein